MITSSALLHGDRDLLLGYDEVEHPISLQLGGSDPIAMAQCARIAQDRGYDEVNINVGCPSDRVQSGQFGACLMRSPQRVADCVAAMRDAVSIPVTVKHRIGVDDDDQYEDMAHFVRVVSSANADRFTVHARKAWLSGLSPKENRTVPPIRYADVYRLKTEFQDLAIEINGQIKTLEDVHNHLAKLDAVMIGRAAWDNPFVFATVDAEIFGQPQRQITRSQIATAMRPQLQAAKANGKRLGPHLRPMLNLYAGQPGARRWKQILTTQGFHADADDSVIEIALKAVEEIQARQTVLEESRIPRQ